MVKHTELLPGQVVLTDRYRGGDIEKTKVVKITPKTVVTQEAPYLFEEVHNSVSSHNALYLYDDEVYKQIKAHMNEISGIWKKIAAAKAKLERVTFE